MTMYAVSIECFGGGLICPSIDEVREVLANDLTVGDIATVKVVTMSEQEFDRLPEFEGW